MWPSSKASSKNALSKSQSELLYNLSPTEENIALSSSPCKDSLEWDRVQSLRNYINMKFQKGEFKDADFDKDDSSSTEKQKESSVSYPSADIIKTRVKSLSTATTLNKFDKDTSGKYTKFGRLNGHHYWATQEIEQIPEETRTNNDEYYLNDLTSSPPLARQLFAKHDLFDTEQIIIHDGKPKESHLEWFGDESNPTMSPTLNEIQEDPDSSLATSQGKPTIPSCLISNSMENEYMRNSVNTTDPNTVVFRIKLTGDELKSLTNSDLKRDVELSIELNGWDKNSFLTNQCVEQISHKLLSGIKEQLKNISPNDYYKTQTDITVKENHNAKLEKRKLSKNKSMQFNLNHKFSKKLKEGKIIDKNKISLISSKSIINSARSNPNVKLAKPESIKGIKISDSLKAKLSSKRNTRYLKTKQLTHRPSSKRKPLGEIKIDNNSSSKGNQKHMYSCRQVKPKLKHKKPKNYKTIDKENISNLQNNKVSHLASSVEIEFENNLNYKNQLGKDSAEVSNNSQIYDSLSSEIPVLEVPGFVYGLQNSQNMPQKMNLDLVSNSKWIEGRKQSVPKRKTLSN